MALSHLTDIYSWSIVKYHPYSPDVCTLHIKIDKHKHDADANANADGAKYLEFRMSRDTNLGLESKLPPSLLFDS
eukprot:CAMPEP_0197830776 /NCGR_PEP_ID=MMETSP1437-20131217/7393_1 /TAXON_ID=49252 ORGANISM="Eucampia antarctica, Strain CCMP1452" /NCGR_SAMPLE_ID=MMETSP1437 /ASSEMBLY_ACC=CAM_ASM_001096 /LENGTH=74 /DNA_ID=CAMNT_0043433381 /DNA_START=8 /DNA_END=229 /DNA_ORIENTATION=+